LGRAERSRSNRRRTYVIAYARVPEIRIGERVSAATAESLARSRAGALDRPMQRIDVPSTLGLRVRALREGMGLSLREMSLRSGVSAPMLSQVERGETSPTLQIAARIASGLELRLSQLLRLDEDGAVTIVRTGERRKGPSEAAGHSYEILTPPLPGQRAELSRHVLAAGAVTGGPGDPPMHEPGSRETALVEYGSVVLHCDDARHELGAGDCVTFDADLTHHFENPGPEEAVLLAIVSAGLRRS
jgi:XRE family transcriptional regulator, regulator of sulfur utilization